MQEKADQVMDLLEITHLASHRTDQMSSGEIRRVLIGRALVHEPRALILDEPTDGLDPNQKHQVREMIKGLSKDKIVIVSTHILEEVTAVCNRVIVLSDGKVVVDTSPDELISQSEFHGAVVMSLKKDEQAAAVAEMLSSLSGVRRIVKEAHVLTVFPSENDSGLYGRVYEASVSQSWPVESIHLEKGRLDDVFRKLTEGAGP